MTNETSTVLKDVKIRGILECNNNCFFDGELHGEIVSGGNLVIGENAAINGNVSAKNVELLGKIEGNISATDHCKIKPSSAMVGDIRTRILEIAEGATFEGRLSVIRESENERKQIPFPVLNHREINDSAAMMN